MIEHEHEHHKRDDNYVEEQCPNCGKTERRRLSKLESVLGPMPGKIRILFWLTVMAAILILAVGEAFGDVQWSNILKAAGIGLM